MAPWVIGIPHILRPERAKGNVRNVFRMELPMFPAGSIHVVVFHDNKDNRYNTIGICIFNGIVPVDHVCREKPYVWEYCLFRMLKK